MPMCLWIPNSNTDHLEVNTLITVAVTPQLDAGLACLLTPADYETIKGEYEVHQKVEREMNLEVESDTEQDSSELDAINDVEGEILVATVTNSTIEDPTAIQKENIERIREQQKSDVTLRECWEDATRKRRQFYFRCIDEVLYHIGQVLGRTVHQLVVPAGQRAEIMRIGHDIEWSGHLAAGKTFQRIAVSFFWPNMKKEIKEYCRTCRSCQLKRRTTCWDRVPISAVVRPEHVFEVMNYDLIGPFMNKSNGFAWVLTCIDQCSRWVEAVPVRNLQAKTICEALLWIWTRTGIPRVVVADNATCNTAELTRELTKRLGVSPRFSTPFHRS